MNSLSTQTILISILISGKSSYEPILSYFTFYTPDFALEEIEKYKSIIFEKTKLKEDELHQFAFFVFSQVSTLPNMILSEEALQKSTELTRNIDIKDMSYVALAIQLNQVLLTRDKELLKGLKKKGFRKVLLFEEFLKSI